MRLKSGFLPWSSRCIWSHIQYMDHEGVLSGSLTDTSFLSPSSVFLMIVLKKGLRKGSRRCPPSKCLNHRINDSTAGRYEPAYETACRG